MITPALERIDMTIILNINGYNYQVEAEPKELLVWVLREKLKMTETRFGCGVEMCGACTVLVDNKLTRSCITSVSEVIGRKIVTREGGDESSFQ